MRISTAIPLTLPEVADAISAFPLPKINSKINSITTSSTEVSKDDLFFALSGERFNGEDFVSEAKAHGAYAVSQVLEEGNLVVKDTRVALLLLASYYKRRLKGVKHTVAITGSVGKTTTKNILSHLLSAHEKTHSTEGNFNNEIGLSYTVLSAPADTEALVCELGMNHIGEISTLSRAISPDIGIITNIGNAHIGNLGSIEKIAKAKLELLDGMSGGVLIIPHKNPYLSQIKEAYTVSIGDTDADLYISITSQTDKGSLIDVRGRNMKINSLYLPLPGTSAVYGLGFSLAVCDILRVREDTVEKAVSTLNSTAVRGKIIDFGDFSILEDTYNSSPESVIADLELMKLYKNDKKSCILGDMLELGEKSSDMHELVGIEIAKRGFDKLYTFGKNAELIAISAIHAGMDKSKVHVNTDNESPRLTALSVIKNHEAGELILCKGSHASGTDKIITEIWDILSKSKETKGL